MVFGDMYTCSTVAKRNDKQKPIFCEVAYMQIGIINFHFSHNYGAVLECIALKEVINALGHQVSVIDYRPTYLVQQQTVYPNPIEYAKWAAGDFHDSTVIYRWYRMIRRAAQAIFKYRNVALRKQREHAFEPFIERNMCLTKRYTTQDELRANPPAFDVYISGSDQIWNPYVTGGKLDPCYFLQFGVDTIRRVAYAVSPCQLDVQKYAEALNVYLSRYAAISLREDEKRNELRRIVGNDIPICLDPTLLLPADEYRRFEETISEEKPYILVYGFLDRDDLHLLEQTTEMLAQTMCMRIIDISQDSLKWSIATIQYKSVTPGEFLSYIKNATYVVTNSFHGTAFSLIYHKRLLSVKKSGTGSRLFQILSQVGLSRLYIEDAVQSDIMREILCDIDYKESDKKLSLLANDSISYIVASLSQFGSIEKA